ncbi:hypothetical protein D3C84_999940 [compost metagenome]
MRSDIPHGIEFELAEIGRADRWAGARNQLDLQDRYGRFNLLRHSRGGVLHRPAP